MLQRALIGGAPNGQAEQKWNEITIGLTDKNFYLIQLDREMFSFLFLQFFRLNFLSSGIAQASRYCIEDFIIFIADQSFFFCLLLAGLFLETSAIVNNIIWCTAQAQPTCVGSRTLTMEGGNLTLDRFCDSAWIYPIREIL